MQETVGQGIVFVPPGRYRLTKTVYVWPSIRLIGYGAKRPVFVLAANTPGYQDTNAENYMVFFAGARPGPWERRARRAGAAGRGRRRRRRRPVPAAAHRRATVRPTPAPGPSTRR